MLASTGAPPVLRFGRNAPTMPSDLLSGLLDGFPDWFTTGLIVAAVVLLLAPAVPLLAIAPLLLARGALPRGQGWPSAMGTVVSAGVEARTSSPRDGGPSTRYHLRIAYSYAVQGREYHGSRLIGAGAPGFDKPELAQAAARPYLPGNPVQIYYDPANPGEAVLERPAPAGSTLRGAGVAAGIMLAVAGIIGLALVAAPIWLIVKLVGYSFL